MTEKAPIGRAIAAAPVLAAPGRIAPTPPPARTRATGTSVVPDALVTAGPNTWSRPSRSATAATTSDDTDRAGTFWAGRAGVESVMPHSLPPAPEPGYGRIEST
ncbi:hypothetical protein GCM10009608_05480 [Pseudonocardia alaniniphila]